MKYKQNEDLSHSSLFSPWESLSNNGYISLSNRRQRNTSKRSKDYTDILINGSMKDIHTPNCYASFHSTVNMRYDNYPSHRGNSLKEQIDDYKNEMINNSNTNKKQISAVQKKFEINAFLKVSPLTIMNNVFIDKKERIKKLKENSFNILQVNKEDTKKINKSKFISQQKIKSFDKTNSYNMLFYCNEIDNFNRGFLLND